MENMDEIRAAVEAAPEDSGARQIGEVVLMIAGASEQAAEIIAADLGNPAMGLEQCFTALRSYAQKHQQGGFWGCLCNRFDLANTVIQVVCDFYKVPQAAFGEETQAIGAALGESMGAKRGEKDGAPGSSRPTRDDEAALDLMELL